MEQLLGSGSVLCGAVWDAHGVPSMARMHALRHLRCDASRRFVRRDDETDADLAGNGTADGDLDDPELNVPVEIVAGVETIVEF